MAFHRYIDTLLTAILTNTFVRHPDSRLGLDFIDDFWRASGSKPTSIILILIKGIRSDVGTQLLILLIGYLGTSGVRAIQVPSSVSSYSTN